MKNENVKPSILIIEDQEINHALYKEAFSFSGFIVSLRKSADDGFVEEVAAMQPAIIAMDFMIGEERSIAAIDGMEALRLLKDDERTKNIPVIMLTNYINEEKMSEAKILGARDYVFLQGQQIRKIADHFMWCVLEPKKFIPIQPSFRT